MVITLVKVYPVETKQTIRCDVELKIDKTLGKGVSIPFKKLKNVYSAFDELFDEILTFNKYKFFLVGITIVNEEECFWNSGKTYERYIYCRV